MKKKILSIVLAGTIAASMASVGVVSVAAEDDTGLTPGSYVDHPTYTPSDAKIKTNRLMFAMPAAWQNDITKKDKDGGRCGLYWWSGFDKPGDQGWSNAWPGYQATKVVEEGVDNLYEIDVPTYGNGEAGNATQIIWNNFLDGGTEKDTSKNPFYEAAQQTIDFPGQYYSRIDEHETYDVLIRYIYKKHLAAAGVDGVDALDLNSDTFWEDINKLAAVYNGEDWDSLGADEKTYQIDFILDEMDLDLDEFGAYKDNFFNEDLVDSPEESNGFGAAFTFDNMVFVVDFDPDKMILSPLSGKIGYAGDWYFYYGGGEYGSWPTKELNEQMGGVSGNFAQGQYVDPNYKPPVPTVVPTTAPAGKDGDGTVPPAGTDAASSTSDSPSGSDSSNNSNGAIATGQFSMAAIVLVILIAGAGVVFFTRRKVQK